MSTKEQTGNNNLCEKTTASMNIYAQEEQSSMETDTYLQEQTSTEFCARQSESMEMNVQQVGNNNIIHTPVITQDISTINDNMSVRQEAVKYLVKK